MKCPDQVVRNVQIKSSEMSRSSRQKTVRYFTEDNKATEQCWILLGKGGYFQRECCN